MDRPIATLFMLMSVDGKISTGSTDELDVDRDFPKLPGVREGLHQYYEIEQTTDLWSFNTGRVQAKMGVNEKELPDKTPVSFVLLDNHHLTEHGIRYFCAKSKQAVVITSNASHPAFRVDSDNLHIIYQERPSLSAALEHLKKEYSCERLTVQSGGTVNGLFLRDKLLDYVDIVVAPVLIGGKDTPTLIDGKSLISSAELSELGVLKLIDYPEPISYFANAMFFIFECSFSCRPARSSEKVAEWKTGTEVYVFSHPKGWYEIEYDGIHRL